MVISSISQRVHRGFGELSGLIIIDRGRATPEVYHRPSERHTGTVFADRRTNTIPMIGGQLKGRIRGRHGTARDSRTHSLLAPTHASDHCVRFIL